MDERTPKGGSLLVVWGPRVAWLAALVAVLYSIAFAVHDKNGGRTAAFLEAKFLALGGVLAVIVAVALYGRLHERDPGAALLALVLGVAGGFGAAVHGAFDLAGVIDKPTIGLSVANPIDPRGFMTFFVAALAIALWSYLAARDAAIPSWFSTLGYVSAALLVVIYIGRLAGLDADNPALLGPALVEGLIVNPLWFIAVARNVLRSPA